LHPNNVARALVLNTHNLFTVVTGEEHDFQKKFVGMKHARSETEIVITEKVR
jgi:hypothetical protein